MSKISKTDKSSKQNSDAQFQARLIQTFEAGHHRDLVRDIAAPGTTSTESTVLICSLSFLGRLDEAVAIWNLKSEYLSSTEQSRARFALGLAFTRASKFKTARKWLRENLHAPEGKQFADTYQGIAVYYYYLGQFEKALKNARKALRLSIEKNDSYIRAFATDLYGHALVQTGKRSLGIQRLTEARALAGKTHKADPFSVAKLIYEAEGGVRPLSIVGELIAMLEDAGQEDTFTRGNLSLELARQYTLRGAWKDARDLLDRESGPIYASGNRRQEATLLLRLAELMYRIGDRMSVQHFLFSAKRCLNHIADAIYEIRILGLEHKVERRLFQREPSTESQAKLLSLSRSHPSPMNAQILKRNRTTNESLGFAETEDQDPLGLLMNLVSSNPSKLADEYLKQGYLGLWIEARGLQPGEEVLYILENHSWVAARADRVVHNTTPLSPLSVKLLNALAKGPANKDILIETVWEYQYDPLRHDSIVYAALGALRKALGDTASWIQSREEGWILMGRHGTIRLDFARAKISLSKDEALEAVASASIDDSSPLELNWRQIRALTMIEAGPWRISHYKKVFSVSTMTAWRDLDELVKSGYLVKVGRGRATCYPFVKSRLASVE